MQEKTIASKMLSSVVGTCTFAGVNNLLACGSVPDMAQPYWSGSLIKVICVKSNLCPYVGTFLYNINHFEISFLHQDTGTISGE